MEPAQDTIQSILQHEAAVGERRAAARIAARARIEAARAAAKQQVKEAEQEGLDAAAREVATAMQQLQEETAVHLGAAQARTEEILILGERHLAAAVAQALALLTGESQ